jgi:gamma-glutamyl-gamma-aminobutyrate hydrolase PuuD
MLSKVKGIVGIVASLGAGAVVGNLIKTTTPASAGKIAKVLAGIGGLVLTGVTSVLAAQYAENEVDNIAEAVKKAKETTEVEDGGEKAD